MPRNSHTITRFKGISLTDSVANIPPNQAISCFNVFADTGGTLSQFQHPTILYVEPSLVYNSLGQLPQPPNSNPRLVIQSGLHLTFSDFPYTSTPTPYGGPIAASPARYDYAFCNSTLFISNGQDSRYLLQAGSGSGSGIIPSPDMVANLWGIAPPPQPTLVVCSTTWARSSVTLQRTGGVLTITWLINGLGVAGAPIYIDSDPSAPWPPSMQGLFQIASIASGGLVATVNQPGLPDDGPYTRAAYPSGIAASTGWQYGASYGNSVIGHYSSLSPYSASTGPSLTTSGTTQSPVVLVPPSPDAQVNQVAFFRNQDSVAPGGGLWYLDQVVSPIPSGPYAGYYLLCDTMSDEQLATSGITAPYDNGVAPPAKYLAVWLDRLLACGITGDPISVRYTGYDSIQFGNPQMCWPQFNSIKLGQGQGIPMGMGLLRYGGMIFFGTDGLMYVYRGTLNDITLSAPVSLSFYAEQLPYNIGLYSHFSIQPSPSGLIWLDDALNLRVMDNTGFYPPKELAPQLSALFRRMTPGSQDKITSSYISKHERHWYTISFPVDGSLTNNMTVAVDLTANPDQNSGAWPCSHAITDMRWVLYADGSLHLIAIQPSLDPPFAGASFLTEIPLIQGDVQGISTGATNSPLPGSYWQGGYAGLHDEQGVDQWSQIKEFRYIRLAANQALTASAYVVDGESRTWESPGFYPFNMDAQNCGGLNQKGRGMSPVITFPDAQMTFLNSYLAAWVVVSTR